MLSSPSPRLLDAEHDAFVGCLRRCASILTGNGSHVQRAECRDVLIGGGVWELVVANELDRLADESEASRTGSESGGREGSRKQWTDEHGHGADGGNDNDEVLKTVMLRVMAECLRDLVVLLLMNAGNDRRFPSAYQAAHDADALADIEVHKSAAMSGDIACHGDSVGVVRTLAKILRDARGSEEAVAMARRVLLRAVEDGGATGDGGGSCTTLRLDFVYDDIETRVTGIRNAVDAVSDVACTDVVAR